MKKKVFFFSSFLLIVLLQACNLPPHYTKKKIPEEDSARDWEKQNSEIDINYPSFTPEFSKLDKNILMSLFHGDSIDKNGSVYWIPTIDEMLEQTPDPSVHITNIEEVYYFKENGKKRAFVLFVTFDEFAQAQAHSSAPIIGGAYFKYQENKKWTLENIDKAITRHGEMGYLKPFSFVRCGKDKYALQLSHSYSGTGQTTESDYFYDLKELREIFSFNTGGSYDESSDIGYRFSSEISFTDPHMEGLYWYDLVVKVEGTEYKGEETGVTNVDTIIRYRFNNLRHVYEPRCDF